MKRKAVLGIMLTLLFIGMLTLAFNIQLVRPVEASTLTPHSPIQINGDSGFVPAAGVTGGSGISEDPYIIEGWDINASQDVGINIRYTRAYFIIRNVFIHDGYFDGGWHGISLVNVTNGEVSGASITRNANGISLSHSSNNVISGNNITANNGEGISLNDSSNNTVSGNNITNNVGGIGLGGSSNNTISGNNITANSGSGISLYVSSNNNITGNTASNNTRGISLDSSSNNNTVTGNNVSSNNEDGILLDSSSYNTVTGNIVSNNGDGIFLGSSSNNNIIGNIALNNGNGIFFFDLCYNNTITGNTISNNTSNGIQLYSCNHNTIAGNTASNNRYGIFLYGSSNNTVTGNTVSSSNWDGIHLLVSSNNTFFHNNLVSNTQQASNTTPDYANSWDDGYPSGGNYWSNYTGVDLNHDGIGDTSHVIDANNTDRYPLMGMFHSFNTSVGEYVNVVSNSTVESFQHFEFNSTIIMHVSNMTANQTLGFCRISIPYEVMSEPFSVTIDGANPNYWNYTLYDNGTHRWIYFEYEHTTREVVIIPEFPAFLILPLFMIATLLSIIVYRRKHSM